MPRNKRQQVAEEKREEIVVAARELFVAEGYDATPMNRIAQSAGVTPNTIYWYFQDKDAVLIAVLNGLVEEAWSEYLEIAQSPVDEVLMWVLERLERAGQLVTTVHSRVLVSPEVNEWHDRFHMVTEGVLRDLLERAGVRASNLDAEVRLGVFAIEGMLTHGLTKSENEAICKALASRWLPVESSISR